MSYAPYYAAAKPELIQAETTIVQLETELHAAEQKLAKALVEVERVREIFCELFALCRSFAHSNPMMAIRSAVEDGVKSRATITALQKAVIAKDEALNESSGVIKLLYRDKPTGLIASVNETLDRIAAALLPTAGADYVRREVMRELINAHDHFDAVHADYMVEQSRELAEKVSDASCRVLKATDAARAELAKGEK
jgi:hypothetical protein